MSKMKCLSFILIAAVLFNGCSIKLGPDPVDELRPATQGLVRIGDVTETLTGSWANFPNRVGIKQEFMGVLKKPEVSSFFGGGISSLVMDIQITTDHIDDGARLTSLGGLSLLTIGIIPLNFRSEWDVQCKVTLKTSEGVQAAVYNFTEKGVYEIWAYPLTMFSLFGAGVRGESDFWAICRRVSENLVDKIIQTVERDAAALSSQAGPMGQAGSYQTLQKPVII
ncbi:MAG: hypothetical protein HY714_06195 [Candidatus Omnitrophica bacterium]|nr:hypothetical protein [Candidatus Omnitrophota bacterium]